MNGAPTLTLRQREIYEYLRACHARGDPAPSLAAIGQALDLPPGSALDRQVAALVAAGLVHAPGEDRGGIRLAAPADPVPTQLPLLGALTAAASTGIHAVTPGHNHA